MWLCVNASLQSPSSLPPSSLPPFLPLSFSLSPSSLLPFSLCPPFLLRMRKKRFAWKLMFLERFPLSQFPVDIRACSVTVLSSSSLPPSSVFPPSFSLCPPLLLLPPMHTCTQFSYHQNIATYYGAFIQKGDPGHEDQLWVGSLPLTHPPWAVFIRELTLCILYLLVNLLCVVVMKSLTSVHN